MILASDFRLKPVVAPPLAFRAKGKGDDYLLQLRRTDGRVEELSLLGEKYSRALPSWTPDGKSIYFNVDNELRSWNAESRQINLIWAGEDHEIIWDTFRMSKSDGSLIFRTRHIGGERPGFSRILSYRPHEKSEVTLYEDYFYDCEIAPDATYALISKDSRLYRLCLESKTLRLLLDQPMHHFAISPLGEAVICLAEQILVMDKDLTLSLQLEMTARYPAWNTDGSKLAFTAHDYELSLLEFSPQKGEPTIRLVARLDGIPEEERTPIKESGSSYSTLPAWSECGRYLCAALTESKESNASVRCLYKHASVLADLEQNLVEHWEGRHLSPSFAPSPAINSADPQGFT